MPDFPIPKSPRSLRSSPGQRPSDSRRMPAPSPGRSGEVLRIELASDVRVVHPYALQLVNALDGPLGHLAGPAEDDALLSLHPQGRSCSLPDDASLPLCDRGHDVGDELTGCGGGIDADIHCD